MKREILFRGKTKLNNKWIFGMPTYDFEYIFNSESVDSVDNFEVIPETVGQFTGLTDKNGVKIFSDDLRKDSDGVIFRIYETYGGFIIKANYWKSDCKDLIPIDELIYESLSNPQTAQWIKESTVHFGNIHDNPELLKS